jgi:hypothetical protein
VPVMYSLIESWVAWLKRRMPEGER